MQAFLRSKTAHDGNGNVMALVSATDRSILAQYEYGPFGEVIRSTGPMAKTNPFRFSTKYQDDETDLLYYGHRYYNPSTGRWNSRDPVEEEGGSNLYSFISNNPISRLDYLGASDCTMSGPWSMFFHSLFGAPFSIPSLSKELINQAKNNAGTLERRLMANLRFDMKCGRSGTKQIQGDDPTFTLEKALHVGIAHMGRWQLRLTGMCTWSCEEAKPPSCCCKCKATCDFSGFLSKTYTFQPWDYNDWNGPFAALWIGSHICQQIQYGVSTGGYMMFGTFSDTVAREYKICDKNALPK
jgi:RHS repeat-associated protein